MSSSGEDVTEEAAESSGRYLNTTWLNTALTLSGVVFVLTPIALAGIRIAALSQGDPDLIAIIVSNLDFKTVTFGSILPVLPTIALQVISLGAIELNYREKRKAATYTLATATLFILSATILAVALAVIAAITLTLSYVANKQREKRKMGPRPARIELSTLKERVTWLKKDRPEEALVAIRDIEVRLDILNEHIKVESATNQSKIDRLERVLPIAEKLRTVGLIVVFCTMVYSIAFSRVWLPVEDIKMRADEVRTAVVLRESGSDLIVLYWNSRQAARVPISHVESRVLCRARDRSWDMRSLPMLLDGVPELPRCKGSS